MSLFTLTWYQWSLADLYEIRQNWRQIRTQRPWFLKKTKFSHSFRLPVQDTYNEKISATNILCTIRRQSLRELWTKWTQINPYILRSAAAAIQAILPILLALLSLNPCTDGHQTLIESAPWSAWPTHQKSARSDPPCGHRSRSKMAENGRKRPFFDFLSRFSQHPVIVGD